MSSNFFAPTSDKDIGWVGFISRLGGNTQGVKPLVLFVEVCKRQCGSISAPVHVVPFRSRQQNIWGKDGGWLRTWTSNMPSCKLVQQSTSYRLCTTGPLAGSGAGQGKWWPYIPNSSSHLLFRMRHQIYQQCESWRWCRTPTPDHLQSKQETAELQNLAWLNSTQVEEWHMTPWKIQNMITSVIIPTEQKAMTIS